MACKPFCDSDFSLMWHTHSSISWNLLYFNTLLMCHWMDALFMLIYLSFTNLIPTNGLVNKSAHTSYLRELHMMHPHTSQLFEYFLLTIREHGRLILQVVHQPSKISPIICIWFSHSCAYKRDYRLYIRPASLTQIDTLDYKYVKCIFLSWRNRFYLP